MASALPELVPELHRHAGHTAMLAQRLAVEQERVPTWTYFGKAKRRTGSKTRAELAREAFYRREDQHRDWEATIQEMSDAWYANIDIDAMIRWYQTAWKLPTQKRRFFRKAEGPVSLFDPDDPATMPEEPSAAEQLAATNAWLNSPEGLIAQGAAQLYLGQAGHTSQAAGQSALDHMGLNKTFAWAHPRAMARDLFAVRGSKVVSNLYDEHMTALRKIILRATDPRHPQTLDQVKALLRKEWPVAQAKDISRIARTETAALWTHTSLNSYAANGITQFTSLIAEGPSIGIESEDPCDECIDAASTTFDITDDPPPWHPNCRCEAIPVLTDENGDPWLPPDEPFTGEDIPMCEEEEAFELRRRADVRKALALRLPHARLKKMSGVDAACLIPSPEPGQAFGGDDFHTMPPLTDEQLNALLKEVSEWPEFAGDAPQAAIKDTARSILRSKRRKKLARNSQSKKLTGVADFDDGLMFPGKPQTIYVRHIATQGGGARRILSAIARDAYAQKKGLAVTESGISKPMLGNLQKWGFTEVEGEGETAWYMDRAKLRDTFKITEEEVPKDPFPTHEHVAPTPVTDLDSLAARKKSAQNRLAGHRKKLKKLYEEPVKNAEQIEVFEAKVASEVAEIDTLNAQIESAKLVHPAPLPSEVPAHPVEIPKHEVELPAVPTHAEVHAAAYDGVVERAPFGDMPSVEAMDNLREQSASWISEGWKPGELPNQIITDLEEADTTVTGFSDGLISLRDSDGALRALAPVTEYKDANAMTMRGIALASEADLEGTLRAVTQGAKLAHERGVGSFTFQMESPLAFELDLDAALTDRGFTRSYNSWTLDKEGMNTQAWLEAEPLPLVAETEATLIEDTISIGEGEPLTQAELAKIKALGLEHYPEKGDGAIKALKGADSTKALYYDYETEEWAVERVEKMWKQIEEAFYKGKSPDTGTPLYSVKYKNAHTGADVETAPMNLEDAQAMQHHIPGASEIVQRSGFKKTAYFTSGGGGAGKSASEFTYRGKDMTLKELKTQDDVIYVNPDDIREMLPEYQAMIDAHDTYAAAGTHAEASAIAKVIQKKAISQGYSVLIDGTAGKSNFIGKIDRAIEADYEVQVTMTSIDTNEAIVRSLSRGDKSGRYVPIDTLKEAHAGASRMMDSWMADERVAHWRVYDNSGSAPKLVARGSKGETTTALDKKLLQRIKDKRKEAPEPREKEIPEHGALPQMFGTAEATPESLKVQLYGAQNRIAGHKKKIKALLEKGDDEQVAVFKEKLAQDEQLRDDIKAKLVDMGHKPVALKPGAAPEAAPKPTPTPKPAPKPKPAKPTPVETPTLTTYKVEYTDAVTGKHVVTEFPTLPQAKAYAEEIPVSVSVKKPQVITVETPIKPPHAEAPVKPKAPAEPAQPKAHQPDNRRVVPGGITKEKGTTKLNKQMTDDQKRPSQGGIGPEGMKRRIVEDISGRLRETDFNADRVRGAYGYSGAHYDESGDKAIISQLIQNWARTSSDADARGVAIQIAAAEELGLDVEAFAAEYWNDKVRSDEVVRQAHKLLDGEAWFEGSAYREAGPEQFQVTFYAKDNAYSMRTEKYATRAEAERRLQDLDAAGARVTSGVRDGGRIDVLDAAAKRPSIRQDLRRFVRAQYEHTQKFLKDAGIEEVTVYRGYRIPSSAVGLGPGQTGWEPGLSTITVRDNPLASWTTAHRVARRSHFYGGTMLRASVPREMVFGSCLTGFGCAEEYEVIVLNAGDNAAWVAQNGEIVLSETAKAKIKQTIDRLADEGAALQREIDSLAPHSIAPDYGTPERQRYNAAISEKRTADYQRQIAEAQWQRGTTSWTYDKEADLKNYIHEAVAENPSLAGKEVKLPKQPVPQTAEQAALRPYKQKVTSLKRMISNRQKKIDTYKAMFMERMEVIRQGNADFFVSWDEALDSTDIYGVVSDYNLRRLVQNAKQYRRTITQTLQPRLHEAETLLASKTKELGYTKAMRKLRRRAGLVGR